MIASLNIDKPLTAGKKLIMPTVQLNFRPTINVVVGRNGSGKSSLLNGIVAQAYKHNKKAGGKDVPWSTDTLINKDWTTSFKPTWTITGKYIKLRYFNSTAHAYQNATAFDYDMPLEMQFNGSRSSSGIRLINNFASIMGKKEDLDGAMIVMDQPEASLDYHMLNGMAELFLNWAMSRNVQIIMATHSATLMALANQVIECKVGEAPRWIDTGEFITASQVDKRIKSFLFCSEEDQKKRWADARR